MRKGSNRKGVYQKAIKIHLRIFYPVNIAWELELAIARAFDRFGETNLANVAFRPSSTWNWPRKAQVKKREWRTALLHATYSDSVVERLMNSQSLVQTVEPLACVFAAVWLDHACLNVPMLYWQLRGRVVLLQFASYPVWLIKSWAASKCLNNFFFGARGSKVSQRDLPHPGDVCRSRWSERGGDTNKHECPNCITSSFVRCYLLLSNHISNSNKNIHE